MPSLPAVFVRLPSQHPSVRAMKRFSNSRTASSNCTPRSTMSPTSCSSRSLIIGAAPASCEFFPRQPVKRLDVLRPGVEDDVVGEAGDRWLLVPLDPLQVVTDELLVEARLRAAPRVFVCG